MSAATLHLIKPIAEQFREQIADPALLAKTMFQIKELASIRNKQYHTMQEWLRVRGWFSVETPRPCGGRPIRWYSISNLNDSEQESLNSLRKRLERLRRKQERAAAGLEAHPGGLVVREDDKRLALTRAEREVIQGLYLKRHEPGVGHLMKLLARDCIRCHAAPMARVKRGADGRYGLYRCENERCGLAFSYSTVWRIVQALPPEAARRARNGINAGVNALGIYRDRTWEEPRRNQRVYGDHHELDLLVWDEREPFLRGGEPRLFRPWLSAFQDRATGVVGWRIGEQANADLLALAFRAYVLRFGIPEEAWVDNGKDYCSEAYQRLCKHLGTELHHTLPSSRTGESHAKSKPIERWFGTVERDLIRTLPGWCGTHPKERPDDVLFTQRKQHAAFLRRERSDTPFRNLQQLILAFEAWVEQSFHKLPSETADAPPLEAFMADLRPVKTVSNERALDILLWRAKTRMIGRNGVSVEGRMYWSAEFFGLRGLACAVRWDPGDIGQVVVSVQQLGKKDQIVIATSEAWRDLAESDYERFRHLKKQERQTVAAYIEQRERAAAGIKPYDQMLLEAQARDGVQAALPVAAVAGGRSVRVMTEGHRILGALGNLPQRTQGIQKLERPEGDEGPRLKLMPDDWARPKTAARPIFTSLAEKEEWEAERGQDSSG